MIGSAAPIPPSLAAAGALLDRLPPAVSLDEAASIAAAYFGVTVTGAPAMLSAERDCNIRLTTPDGALLLKISNPAEDQAAIEAQTLALLHIAAHAPSLPVPRVILTLANDPVLLWHSPTGMLRVRLLTYLPGQPLHLTAASTAQRRSVGRLLARLALALRDFDHPGARRALLWDITTAGDLAVLLPYIADPDRRALATRFLDAFQRFAAPRLPGFRAQTLHNDFNPHNLLVAPGAPAELAGVIDFGDMVHAAQINDLAIASAYDVPVDGHPLAHAADLVGAYHAVNPILPEEIEVLFDLIAVRQVVSVAIGTWRAQRYPENRDYILRNSQAAWRGLERFATLDRADAQAYFRAACGMAA
jgi:Ser/Thr protein kinase RdoA (MazF antagonist)